MVLTQDHGNNLLISLDLKWMHLYAILHFSQLMFDFQMTKIFQCHFHNDSNKILPKKNHILFAV